jgi:Sec-independent protein translocase protein TatA
MGSDVLIVLLVILVLAIMWRGPKTLPKLGAALGRGIKEAKTEAKNAQAEIQARAGGEDTSTADAGPGPDRPA